MQETTDFNITMLPEEDRLENKQLGPEEKIQAALCVAMREDVLKRCRNGGIQTRADMRPYEFAELVRYFAAKIDNPAMIGNRFRTIDNNFSATLDNLTFEQKRHFEHIGIPVANTVLEHLMLMWLGGLNLEQVIQLVLTSDQPTQPHVAQRESALPRATPPQTPTPPPNIRWGREPIPESSSRQEVERRLFERYVQAFQPLQDILVHLDSLSVIADSHNFDQSITVEARRAQAIRDIREFLHQISSREQMRTFIFALFRQHGGRLEFNAGAYQKFQEHILNQQNTKRFFLPHITIRRQDERQQLQMPVNINREHFATHMQSFFQLLKRYKDLSVWQNDSAVIDRYIQNFVTELENSMTWLLLRLGPVSRL